MPPEYLEKERHNFWNPHQTRLYGCVSRFRVSDYNVIPTIALGDATHPCFGIEIAERATALQEIMKEKTVQI
jgi:hypothetical protein